MPTQVKYEESKDLNKVIMRTITSQDFTEFEPDENARSYRKEQVDGVWTVVEEYLYDQGAPQYSVDGTVSTEPLESNRIFAHSIPYSIKQYWAAWKKNPMSPILAKDKSGSIGSWWAPDPDGILNPDFAAFYYRWVCGYDSYLAPKIVVRMTELEDGPAPQENVGKIDTGWRGSGVTVPNGVNFLLTAARGTQEGDKWRNTYEWMSSSANSMNYSGTPGWDDVIYGGGN